MRIFLGALAMFALTGAGPTASSDIPAAYRLRLAVTPAPGAPVQRIAVPAAVLAASQTRNLADLRVFDARGRPMPIARAPVAPPPLRRDTLPALPILGPADALRVTGMSLRLDDHGQARVAQIDGAVDAAAEKAIVLGVLFDARAIAGVAERLTLDADVPASQPVTLTVEAGRNLKDWRPIGEQVLYRQANAAPAAASIEFGDADLRRDYLRVTWRSSPRLLSPVNVRSAVLDARPRGGADAVTIDATLPQIANARTIDIKVPFATPLAAIRIVPTGLDKLVPVRVLGRNTNEQPWTWLGSGVARTEDAPPVALSGGAFNTLRIEADERTSGFTAPPLVRLGFAPQAVAVLFVGEAPYTLSVGNARSTDVYLPLDSLTGQSGNALLTATVAAEPMKLSLALADSGTANKRQLFLWIILFGATILLAGMAWRLWRSNSATT